MVLGQGLVDQFQPLKSILLGMISLLGWALNVRATIETLKFILLRSPLNSDTNAYGREP